MAKAWVSCRIGSITEIAPLHPSELEFTQKYCLLRGSESGVGAYLENWVAEHFLLGHERELEHHQLELIECQQPVPIFVKLQLPAACAHTGADTRTKW